MGSFAVKVSEPARMLPWLLIGQKRGIHSHAVKVSKPMNNVPLTAVNGGMAGHSYGVVLGSLGLPRLVFVGVVRQSLWWGWLAHTRV